MEQTLLEKLMGTWTLIDLIEVPVNGGEITHPMGEKPTGLIIYSSDGYMSAQIMNPDRKNFIKEHCTDGTAEEYTREASTYLAYSGPFKTDNEKQMVSHTMYISLFPNWTGQTQNRKILFKDGFLHLESEKPFMNNSRLVIHKLTWKRVEI